MLANALNHVLKLAREHRIIVQVLPFNAGAHMAMEGPLKLMSFDDAPRSPTFKAWAQGSCTTIPQPSGTMN